MSEIEEKFKNEFERKDKQMRKIKAEEAKMMKLKITYGNTCRLTYPNIDELSDRQAKHKYTWSAFVDLGISRAESEALVKYVEFKLHSTFKNPIRKVEKYPYRMNTNGWGTFDLPIIIHWKDHVKAKKLVLEHEVSFDIENNGETSVYGLKIPRPISKSEIAREVKGRKNLKTRAKSRPPVWR